MTSAGGGLRRQLGREWGCASSTSTGRGRPPPQAPTAWCRAPRRGAARSADEIHGDASRARLTYVPTREGRLMAAGVRGGCGAAYNVAGGERGTMNELAPGASLSGSQCRPMAPPATATCPLAPDIGPPRAARAIPRSRGAAWPERRGSRPDGGTLAAPRLRPRGRRPRGDPTAAAGGADSMVSLV